MRNFRNYEIWKKAIVLATKVYKATSLFPSSEKYVLSNQVQRAVVSIASNIAEGSSRSSEKEFAHILEIAEGSAFEVETQLIIAKEFHYITEGETTPLIEEINILERQINQFRSRLTKNNH